MTKQAHVLILLISINLINASIFDYFTLFSKKENNNNQISNDIIDQNIPYEVSTTDEKFINEAAILTGVALSKLDSCQQRVVLKLQTECHKLNDDQVSKLAVMLLNCQSAIEGRTIYPCTEYMSLRECTSAMNPDIWNSYHIMTNRARAVCYSVRQVQFRGLTEMTVNKLMQTAREQLKSMDQLLTSQQELGDVTLEQIKSVSEGQKALKAQHEDLQKAQFMGQLAIEDNIRQLFREKALIKAGHEQIAKMTQDVKLKLDDASTQIELYSTDQKQKHNEILKDLVDIQRTAKEIWQRVEESTNHMLEQSRKATEQYELTLAQLAQVNATVQQVFSLVERSKLAIDEKLTWLSTTLGGTGNTVEKLYIFLSHVGFLIFSMVICSFLNAPKVTRYTLVILVPLNLALALQKGMQNAFELSGLSFIIVIFTIAHFIIFTLLSFISRNKTPRNAISWFKNKITPEKENRVIMDDGGRYEREPSVMNGVDLNNERLINSPTLNSYYSASSVSNDELDEDELPEMVNSFNHFASPTPPLSRSDVFLTRRTKSRSNSPALSRTMSSLRKNCEAITRSGTLCKNSALPGRQFCYRHQTGASVLGD